MDDWNGSENMNDGVRIVAELMRISAITAPKSMGEDFVEAVVLEHEDIGRLADDMCKIAEERNSPGFKRDGENVRASTSVVLVGLREHTPLGMNCSACGFDTCKELKDKREEREKKDEKDLKGPNCVIRAIDLGIAVGSAVKTASIHNVDNRIMYRVGVSARRLGLIDADVVMGIPLSVSAKSIYYDRK